MPNAVDESTLTEYNKRGGRSQGSVWDGVTEHLLSQEPGQTFEYVNGTDFDYKPRTRTDENGNEVTTDAGTSARGHLAKAVKDKLGDNYAVTVLTRPDANDRFAARVNKLSKAEVRARQERVEKARQTMADRGTQPGRKGNGSSPASEG